MSFMKAQPTPAANKLLRRFDKLLKNMLAEEIKSFRSRDQFLYSNLQAPGQVSL
jgi:hypothetical protein